MKLAAHQPQYLPWLGYFDKIDRVDRFVLLDTVQYKKNEWQNRNRIRAARGWQWLTVPVHHRFPMTLREVRIDDSGPWRRKHREALRLLYARAPHRDALLPRIEALLAEPHETLAALNGRGVAILADALGVRTPIHEASALGPLPDGPDARLIALCRRLGCDTYVAGTGGCGYMEMDVWRQAGIRVEFQRFTAVPYRQAHPGFEPGLSVVDLLMNLGDGALDHLRRSRQAAA